MTAKYPWIGYRNPAKSEEGRYGILEGLWDIGKDYVSGNFAGYISNKIGDWAKKPERSRFASLVGKYFSGRFKAKQTATIGKKIEEKIKTYSPAIAALMDLTEGSTKAEEFFTAEFEGKESTIYIKSSGQTEPSDEQLLAGIESLQKERYSPYQERDKIEPLYRGDFNSPGAEFVTIEDFPNMLQDSDHAMEWFVRDEVFLSQQRGKQLNFSDGSQTKSMGGLKIRKYAKATKWQRFGHWLSTAIVYRSISPFFKTATYLSDALAKGNPVTQVFWEMEYKSASAIMRSLERNPARLYHEMDFREAGNSA